MSKSNKKKQTAKKPTAAERKLEEKAQNKRGIVIIAVIFVLFVAFIVGLAVSGSKDKDSAATTQSAEEQLSQAVEDFEV